MSRSLLMSTIHSSGHIVPVGVASLSLAGLDSTKTQVIIVSATELSVDAISPQLQSQETTIVNVGVGELNLSALAVSKNISLTASIASASISGINSTKRMVSSRQPVYTSVNGLSPLKNLRYLSSLGITQLYGLSPDRRILKSIGLGQGLILGLSPTVIYESGPGPQPEAQLYFTKFNSAGSMKDVLVYIPPLADLTNLPLYIVYHGDGGKGVVSTDTDLSVGTGDGSDTTFGGNFANGVEDVLSTSVVIKVAGVEVARGKIGGTIEGDGVSGTMDVSSTNGSFSLLFDTPPANGASITISYQHSDLFEAGHPYYVNRGFDQPTQGIFLYPQITANDFLVDADYDDLIVFAYEEFGINLNRIYDTGLSRGGFICRTILRDRNQTRTLTLSDGVTEIEVPGSAGHVIVASDLGSGHTWSDYINTPMLWVAATNDTTATIPNQSVLNSTQALNYTVAPETLAIWGNVLVNGHNSTLWNTNCYSRQYRTDGNGTALFDFVEWLWRLSQDVEENATLHVDYAETRPTIQNWRFAKQQVRRLSAGSTKTDLETRLTNLKLVIDGGGRRFIVDFGSTLTTDHTVGRTMNMSSGSAFSSFTNLSDDTNAASPYDLLINTQFASAPADRINTAARCNHKFSGFEKTHNFDGLRIQGNVATSGSPGKMTLQALNPSKQYKITVYHGFGSGNYNDKSEATVRVQGDETIVQFSETNTFRFMEFDWVSPNESNEIEIEAWCSGTGSPVRNWQWNLLEFLESA